MISFELYIDGELYKQCFPENQDEFNYDPNLTAMENEKRIWELAEQYAQVIKTRYWPFIVSYGNYDIYMSPIVEEKY